MGCIFVEIYYKKLAHTVTEADKSQHAWPGFRTNVPPEVQSNVGDDLTKRERIILTATYGKISEVGFNSSFKEMIAFQQVISQ